MCLSFIFFLKKLYLIVLDKLRLFFETILYLGSLTVYPGMPLVPVVEEVHHQDLNKKILIALVVASTLLGGIVLFFSCFWIYRLKKSRKCRAKSKGDGIFFTRVKFAFAATFFLLRHVTNNCACYAHSVLLLFLFKFNM
jgi:predicted permease